LIHVTEKDITMTALKDRGPIQTCARLAEVARVLPPYLQFITKPVLFGGEASVMTVLGGTQELDRVLASDCERRVVIIDAQCQTHTAFFGPRQLQAAIKGKITAVIVFGAICWLSELKKAQMPVIAMGVTPRMAPEDFGSLVRHRILTDIGAIRDDGSAGKGDYVVGSENGIVVARSKLYHNQFAQLPHSGSEPASPDQGWEPASSADDAR
jgi:regulator of RNase E activity RraA